MNARVFRILSRAEAAIRYALLRNIVFRLLKNNLQYAHGAMDLPKLNSILLRAFLRHEVRAAREPEPLHSRPCDAGIQYGPNLGNALKI